ncbi:hypothetical protein GCM10022406_03340 [Hymenobacter algoricola]|uniref:DUF2314 domain-containing protein n=1 Tax=Hymenobacter algoricola TaxID=486267 RepID=A0ABP7MFK7_9BACT
MLLLASAAARAQQPLPAAPAVVAAPADAVSVDPAQSLLLFDQLIAAPVQEALRTLPQAQQRYQAGLKPGETFFLTTRLVDPDGRFEQVFVLVKQWEGAYVQGTIANKLETVTSYTTGQEIEFTTKAVLDWTLIRANGFEEGNYVGKFLDIQNRLDALER